MQLSVHYTKLLRITSVSTPKSTIFWLISCVDDLCCWLRHPAAEEEEQAEEMEADEEEEEEEEEEEMEIDEEPPEITPSEAAMLSDPDPWKRFAAETTVVWKRSRREDAAFYRKFEPAAGSVIEEDSADHLADFPPGEVPSVVERPAADDEAAAYSAPATPSTTVLSLPPTPTPAGAPCVCADEPSRYSTPEVPSTTVIGALPDEPSIFSTPAAPSRTIVRDGVFVYVEPEEESMFPMPEAPSETALHDARRDPCFVETFVDFTERDDIAAREAVWAEEQAKRAPPEVGAEYRGWLDVKLDRTCRGVAATAPDEHAPENMFFEFEDAAEKCARDAVWREQQKEVDREVVTPSFFGWREWMKMEEPPAPLEAQPPAPTVFEDFATPQEKRFRDGVWHREQMEPCPEAVLETLGRPESPRRAPAAPEREGPREVCQEETFSDFPDEEERRRRERVWQEEQAKVLETVFGEKIRCGEKPPDVYRLDTFHDFPDNRERYERDEVWQSEQRKVVAKEEKLFDGWLKETRPEFSDLDGMSDDQVRQRQRAWQKEQDKRLEAGEAEAAPFEGWEAGKGRPAEADTFEDFPDNREKAEREAVWAEEQRRVQAAETAGDEFEGWLKHAEEEPHEPGVEVPVVEMFSDFENQRERCACARVWAEEQNKRSVESGEVFDGWNEWQPETRVDEGKQVVEHFEERGPYVPETFQDFVEPEERQEREAVWTGEQRETMPAERKKAAFDGWLDKRHKTDEEGEGEETLFWDFPDEDESCRRQKVWHDEQQKVCERYHHHHQ